MTTKYTLKFFKGRRLIAEQSWDLDAVFLDEMTHDIEQIVDEALACNPPDVPEEA